MSISIIFLVFDSNDDANPAHAHPLFSSPILTPMPRCIPNQSRKVPPLHILAHHRNHQIKQPNSLHECKAENGVGEQLAAHGRVARHSHDEGREDHADADAGAAEADGRGPHAHVLGDLDHGVGNLGGVGARALAGELRRLEDLGHLGALAGLEGGGFAEGSLRHACEGEDRLGRYLMGQGGRGRKRVCEAQLMSDRMGWVRGAYRRRYAGRAASSCLFGGQGGQPWLRLRP